MLKAITARTLRPLKTSPRLLSTKSEVDLNTNDSDTHFGFETIKASKKTGKVQKVFHHVASNYDIMNDSMSLGVHRLWKDYFIQKLGPTESTHLLDMCGGTGDIAFRFLDYIKDNKATENSHVTVADLNRSMLEVGQTRCQQLKYDSRLISFMEENAEQLSFRDESFTAYTVAFGIRNCTRIDKALVEAYRILKPGGRFLCLEFSHVENDIARWFYNQYNFQIIPVLGQIMVGEFKAYQYLVESIQQFPDQETFKAMIEKAGFKEVTYENLSLGIVAIHSGFKI